MLILSNVRIPRDGSETTMNFDLAGLFTFHFAWRRKSCRTHQHNQLVWAAFPVQSLSKTEDTIRSACRFQSEKRWRQKPLIDHIKPQRIVA